MDFVAFEWCRKLSMVFSCNQLSEIGIIIVSSFICAHELQQNEKSVVQQAYPVSGARPREKEDEI